MLLPADWYSCSGRRTEKMTKQRPNTSQVTFFRSSSPFSVVAINTYRRQSFPSILCLMHTSYRHLRAATTRPRVFASLHCDPLIQHDFPRLSLISRRVCRPQNRGAKTKSCLKFDGLLPSGATPLDPLALKDDVPAYPTVVLQARNNMRKFENCVLLTRVGGFYEMYFEHADEFGPLLNLKVAQKRTNAGNVSMVRSLSAYIPRLTDPSNRLVFHSFN